MSDDLTISNGEPEETEGVVEYTTREEYILCAVYAINAVSEVTTMTKEDEKRKARITRRCLKILDSMVEEMYDELFNEEEND